MTDQKEVLIYGEVGNGKLAPVTLELLGIGRKLADARGALLSVALIDRAAEACSREAIAHGADRVYVISDAPTDYYEGASFSTIMEKLCRDTVMPAILLLGQTLTGRDLTSVVGVAGTTETGSVAPLDNLGDICTEHRIHFHVDAAWGGPTLMSEKYRHLLVGIERADSVTIDGHKQFYMPMSCGMIYFKDPTIMDSIRYHANYVNRPTSVDLGIKSPSGSREANSLILDSALKIMGSRGYALLIDHGIETARKFADEIEKRSDFQVITPPELNILTYRLCPAHLKNRLADGNPEEVAQINEKLNTLNRTVQRLQREVGNSFVSRTTLRSDTWPGQDLVVLRAVIMNPMTTIEILREILDEQEKIYNNRLA